MMTSAFHRYFLDQVQPPTAEEPNIDWIVKALQKDGRVQTVLKIGSSVRRTWIRPLNDVDLLVVLEPSVLCETALGKLVDLLLGVAKGRLGKHCPGAASLLRDVVACVALAGKSVLLLGPPGAGKTTLLREIARLLADEYGKRVNVVDSSNEIAGDGARKHYAVGRARRTCVPLALRTNTAAALVIHRRTSLRSS